MTASVSRFRRSVLAASIGLVLATPAQAVTFEWGDIQGSFDSTWTLGAAWRVEERDLDKIGKSNRFQWSPGYGFDFANGAFNDGGLESSQIFGLPGSYSSNGDLANMLYDKGDTFSEIFKGLHELELVYENVGIFVRGFYFYDNKLENGSFDYRNPLTGEEFDVCADDKASEYACSDIRLLDAYFFADFDLGEMPFSIRIGEQVVSWGESTLIAHGINSINPVDLARLQAPGSELKEAFIPVGTVWASLGLTENFNIEAYYQYRWEETRLPVTGTYFSSNDFAGAGGYVNNAQLGFTSNPDITLDHLLNEYQLLAQASAGAIAQSGATTPEELQAALAPLAPFAVPYGTKTTLVGYEQEPDDQGQFGVKLGYFAPSLNDTEFGLYYINYHSKRPLISGQAADFSGAALIEDLATLSAIAGAGGEVSRDDLLGLNAFSKAVIEYPEDIKLYGFSFNTTLGDTSVAGEIAYRQDEPLQIDDVELLYAAMPEQLYNADNDAYDVFEDLSQYRKPNGERLMPGEFGSGYVLTDSTQAQMTFTHIFGPTFGASNFLMLAEVGGVWLHDMPDPSVLRMNGPGTERAGLAGREDNAGVLNLLHNGPEEDAFPTDSSWGYRIVAKADYTNAMFGWNLSPRVVFSHDVSGTTPDPLFLFIEDRKSASLTLSGDYQNRWSFDVSYNAFWDGKGSTNSLEDKDFVSFNVKFSI
ncbi:protein of unknown function DUF1302 [Ferrimonas balearica DSM 9799]|uniref:DUF1302 domain-containing protein n=1 Tax=Ferrimonas balearica (strain DSM 9799 / CCM 4581 / KCTC 23876 / PAT) TaxID=550540 RepID=E1ST35_FERBD|nr:DUF1302 domain-containing protein [Ferrimonas balearica]ADN76082.1 protein of unknown function DUF1302 [Ferrimonas balearica DSM 9799]